ncbi:MAG: hypothetical protein II236_03190 [Alistipes sp.]|nr:hypothetical protein [Alistipes sp.]MBQ5619070.1 hypothetical protein [Alistipes sp.]MBQ5922799.1 hypothetical protein [Alistipes sp.]
MTEKRFKPVGGVAHAELFAVHGLRGVEDMTPGEGVEVSLMDDGSHYDEQTKASGLPVSVEHTLTLCSDRNLTAAWRNAEFLQRAAAEGVAARIRLSSGEELIVGWSPHFGFERALRLHSLSFHSGSRPQEQPKVVLTLSSRDTSSALDQ